MPLVSSGEYPFHLCKMSFHEYYKFTLAFSVKLLQWLAVCAWRGPGALADSYVVENPNVDFKDLSHTSQCTKSRL